MTNCPFQLNADGLWQCPDCGWIYPRPGPRRSPRRNCPKSPDITEAAERLGITGDDIKHWAQSLAKWMRAKFPMRTPEQVDYCLHICVKCKEFIPSNPKCTGETCRIKIGGYCKACGCRVSKSRVAISNKLAMATEACPKGKWKATA